MGKQTAQAKEVYCLTCTLDHIVMQMRKTNVKRAIPATTEPIVIQYKHTVQIISSIVLSISSWLINTNDQRNKPITVKTVSRFGRIFNIVHDGVVLTFLIFFPILFEGNSTPRLLRAHWC